jgi:diguanylate cyclase (GGDEF)-like protein
MKDIDIENITNNSAVFQDCTFKDVKKVIEKSEIKHYKKEEYIFRQGDTGTFLFIILKGTVDIVTNNEIIAIRREFDIIGEQTLFSNGKRAASVVCGSDYLEIIIFNKHIFNVISNKNPHEFFSRILINIFNIISEKLTESAVTRAEVISKEKQLSEEIEIRKKVEEKLRKLTIKLKKLSLVDSLTELFNRRSIKKYLFNEFSKSLRYKTELSILMIDVDFFKKVNDNYGHQCGDYVLKELAGIIKRMSRKSDICGRYGGEEFIILVPLDKDGALKYANKLLGLIRDYPFTYQKNELKITVSIGTSTYNKNIKDEELLVKFADKALYRAKKQGRNMVIQYDSDES